ncbi:MAG TPA: DUF1579 family protein [Kofleriaceae bacterium]
MMSLALAQPAKTPAAPPAAPAAKGAPAATPAKGAPAVPGDKAPAVKPAEPPKPPEAPAELAAMAKNMAGTWKCTGQADMGGQMNDVKATITFKVEPTLNKFWMQANFVGTAGKMPPFKFTSFTTYDASAGKFWRTSINGRGGHGWAVGTMTDKKVSWEGEAKWVAGDVKTRDSEEMISPKEFKVVGEASKDGGKTWSKDHEATCKK